MTARRSPSLDRAIKTKKETVFDAMTLRKMHINKQMNLTMSAGFLSIACPATVTVSFGVSLQAAAAGKSSPFCFKRSARPSAWALHRSRSKLMVRVTVPRT